MEMIRLKTAVLLAGALKIGAQYAEADEADIENLYQYGIHVGLAFQLQDDLLDAFGDEKTFGKKTGSDIRDNKKTYLLLKSLQIASQEQQEALKKHFASTPDDPEPKVADVLAIYNAIDIRSHVEAEINKEFAMAQEYLSRVRVDQAHKQPIIELTDTLLNREK